MNPEEWQKVEQLFHAALQIKSSERRAFLENACQGDFRLFGEVQKFIKAHEEADDFIQKPVLADAIEILSVQNETASIIGKQFGAYKIISEIGRGGMGAVYLAERTDLEFEKQVAVKIIKRGMDTATILQRFRNERQILASLEHPNIARLLDGGSTADGLPYLVMEYVEGLPVTEYAKTHQLSIKARLELFQKVCSALAYAHQRLIIHRDLKPSNILVTNEGRPKLIDFGIAKLTNPYQINQQTEGNLRLLTPEYASPEQIEGLPVTTLSDVYSLGIVLYELLCGQTPFKGKSLYEIAQIVTTQELIKPSQAVQQNVKMKINPKSLRGDLDDIVLKALRNEPQQRYNSMERFSNDIQKHLLGLPVIAHPLTIPYRLAKFVRRNPIPVSLGAIIFLTLIAGIATTTWQAVRARQQEQLAKAEKARAEKRFNDVRKLARSVLFDYYDAISKLSGSAPARERLVYDSLEYLDSMEAEADASLRLEIAVAYERIGDIRSESRLGNEEAMNGAIESYRKAVKIREDLLKENPQDFDTRRSTAQNHLKIAELLLEKNDFDTAFENNQRALSLFQTLVAEKSKDAGLLSHLARCYGHQGRILTEKGNYEGGLENFQKETEINNLLPKD